ncbi:MAG: TIGR03960 family B12-binding radical SAM protein [Parasporobacterium sp.]|nr:TIGR03960 family B12-binding radical SAM protein [Parasporobacterium sp.]
MDKLKLDRILKEAEKPARYTGGEIGSIVKKPEDVDVRFCMCFPDVYEIGMSHLGIQIIYDMLNKKDNFWCERVYSPWPDMHRLLKEYDMPLYSLESRTPLKEFDFLGFTLQYEMAYTNVLQVLDLGKISLLSCDREENDPLIIGGGPCAYNPEPLADFFDLFYIGEGETVYYELLNLYKECRDKGLSRKETLLKLSSVEGIYVPSLYEASYNNDGTIKDFFVKPEFKGQVPSVIIKQAVPELSETYYPECPVIPYVQASQDRAVLEVERGCIRGCRFCQAGFVYRPFRARSLDFLKKYALALIKNTGYEEISLSSLSTSDYPQLKELMEFLTDELAKDKKVNISLPSLRIDEFALDVMAKVQNVKKSSLTFAPEAGTQRLRDVINKGITEEEILDGSKKAFLAGWTKIKLYFMLGLPLETDEDVKAIPELAESIIKEFYDTIPKEERREKPSITISTSFFIPKPFTPFQWEQMYSPETYLDKAHLVNDTVKGLLNNKRIKYNWHDAQTSIVEGLLARGDRKVGKVIKNVYEAGGLFDAWTDYFEFDRWDKAMAEEGLSWDFYVYRKRSLDEILPWDFIDTGVTKEFMKKEYKNAYDAKVTPDCREHCSGCGAHRYNGEYCPGKETK